MECVFYSHNHALEVLLAKHRRELLQLFRVIGAAIPQRDIVFTGQGRRAGRPKVNTRNLNTQIERGLLRWQAGASLSVLRSFDLTGPENPAIPAGQSMSKADALRYVRGRYSLNDQYSVGWGKIEDVLDAIGRGYLVQRRGARNVVVVQQREFEALDWDRILCAFQVVGRETDYIKNRVALEVQLAHYGLVYNDLNKFRLLWSNGLIDVAIEVVATKALRDDMSDNVARFEKTYAELRTPSSRNEYPYPLLLVGLEEQPVRRVPPIEQVARRFLRPRGAPA